MRSAAVTRRPNRRRTKIHAAVAVAATPTSTADAAAACEWEPSPTHDAKRLGSLRKRAPTAATATSARPPSMRITDDRLRGVRSPSRPTGRTKVGTQEVRLGEAAGRRVRGAEGLLYSGRPRHRGAANQEVSDRAFKAHRPVREPAERPEDGKAGAVYPRPRPRRSGLCDSWGGVLDERGVRWAAPPFAHAP